MDRAEVRGDDLLSRGARLEAEVEVVAVQTAEGLVEAQLSDRPRRHHDHEPVDRLDLAELGVRGNVVGVPGHRRDLAPAVLGIAVGESRPGDGTFPPGDAADADRPRAAHDGDVRIAERLAYFRAELGIDDLGVLMDEDERLEIVTVHDAINDQVVVAEDRSRTALGQDQRIGLGHEAQAGFGAALVDFALSDRAAEGDHEAGRRHGGVASVEVIRASTAPR
jgi:hypothetical protein